ASLQAAFHPGYVPLHRDAALALGDARVWSFGGDGGENERRPEKPVEIAAVENGATRDFTLPPLFDAPAEKEGPPQVEAVAEVVLFDRLVDPSILKLLPADAERVYVGKQADNHAVPQEEIGRLLIAHARRGKRVLRLKGGDPFLFGRGGEEIEALAQENVPFE